MGPRASPSPRPSVAVTGGMVVVDVEGDDYEEAKSGVCVWGGGGHGHGHDTKALKHETPQHNVSDGWTAAASRDSLQRLKRGSLCPKPVSCACLRRLRC